MGAFKVVKLIDPIYIATNGVAMAHTGSTATSGTFKLYEGNNITFTTNGNSLTIHGGAGAGGGVAIAGGTQTAISGTVNFANSNGITFGMSGSTRITASHNGLTIQSTQPVAYSAANGSANFSTLTFADSNGISFSTGTQGLYATVKTDYQTSGAYLTTAALSNHSHGFSADGGSSAFQTLTFANSNGVSFSNSNGSLVATVKTDYQSSNANYLTSQSNQAVSGANGSFTFQTLSLADSNGVSFSTGTQGVYATVKTDYLTTARASNDAIGLNTAKTNVTWTVNSNGLSLDAGGYAGTGFTSTTTAGVDIKATQNTAGLSMAVPAYLTTAQPVGAYLTTAAQSNQVVNSINGSTGVFSFATGSSLSSSINGQSITWGLASNITTALQSAGAYLTTAAQSDHSHGNPTLALTNLSGTTASNSNGLTLSLSAAAGGGVNPAASASNGSFAFTTLNFSNANNVTFGTSAGNIITASVAAPGAAAENNNINLLGANTSGNTTASGSTIGYSGINLTLSGTNGSVVNISAPATSSLSATGQLSISTNGSTISIGVGSTVSNILLVPNGGKGGPLPFAQSSISLGQNSLYVYPFQLEDYLSADQIRMPVFLTNSSSAVSSGQKAITFLMGIYTRNATNNTVLSQHYSTSYTIQASYSSNVSWALSMITAIGNSTSYNTVTASSAGLNLSASLHGPRELLMPLSSVLNPGEYWFALKASSAGSGTVGNILNISNLAVAHQTYNRIGQSTATSNSAFFQQAGMGLYSATTAALPAGISQTQLNLMGTQPIMFAGTGTV